MIDPNSTKPEKRPLFEPIRELISNLERLRRSSTADSSRTLRETLDPRRLLEAAQASGHRYEVIVWGVLMPHLIRNAPKLAPDTVAALQDNHQIEKPLLEILEVHASTDGLNDDESQDHLLTSATRLSGVLRMTLRILESEVSNAFDELPDDQKAALLTVVEHEMVRIGSGEVPVPRGIARALDTLETERPSLPIERPPHAAT